MNYDPNNQYRCTIIRGKSITSMDDLLPFYAETLNELCPIEESLFSNEFDELLSQKKLNISNKAIKNHRTENVESILGMIFKKDGLIELSDRTKQFLKDNDQPMFFKTMCYKFQQPNAAQSISTIKDDLNKDLSFKPFHFILAILKAADEIDITLTKKEIGYFCLNSLDVMQGKVTVSEVIDEIIRYRRNKKSFFIGNPKKASSFNWQHIKEQLDYLRFANLVRFDGSKIHLNKKETDVIQYFINDLSKPLHFKIYNYNIKSKTERKSMTKDWNLYFGSLENIDLNIFATTLDALSIQSKTQKSKKELGDEGEKFVLEYEQNLVNEFNPRLKNKVIHQGTTQGLGYDILSIEAARDKDNPEFARYIEVKSTKRATKPNLDKYWDRVTFTRNEWVAAEQQQDRFFIYRVYFTSEGVFIAVIKNPVSKNKKGELFAAPTQYRIEFNRKAIDDQIKSEKEI